MALLDSLISVWTFKSLENGYGPGWQRSLQKHFSDGKVQFEIEYAMGKLNGRMRRWAQNGQLIQDCNYADDVKEGRSKRWHENGILAEDAFYIDDKLEGEYAQYDERGNVILKAKFKDGELVKDSVSNGQAQPEPPKS